MRSLLLTFWIVLWGVSQAPAVVAGTRAVVEGPRPVDDAPCRGWDGNLYPLGAPECLPLQPRDPSSAPDQTRASPADIEDAAQAPEDPGDQHPFLSTVAVTAVAVAVLGLLAFAAAAIATARRSSRPTPVASPQAQARVMGAEDQPDQAEMDRPAPDVASEAPPAGPPWGGTEDVQGRGVPAPGGADLVTVWTGGPCRIEFTSQDPDGDRRRHTVDITSILRDSRNGGWHLRGFCHLWREERDYDGASIVTKILYKSRRWGLEDWIKTVAGEETRGF